MDGFCRGCLSKFTEPTDLLQYCESNRRLFVYSTGLQVKRNDAFTFQLCKDCYFSMKLSCKFKKQCRNSDKKFKTYLALKDAGESLELGTYLKNIEDTLIRFPIASRSSTTPHRNEDNDDNESTCTSIQNFMTDMLEGEEMPPTEARIIREVIQEEADILEDSLDSHWLQDDNMSVHSDFGMDFNINAFSTPHSINNDHCYTPRRLADDKEEEHHYYNSKEPIQIFSNTKALQQNDMPNLDDYGLKLNDIANDDSNFTIGSLETEYCINEIKESNKQVNQVNTSHQSDMPLLDDCDIEFDGVVDNDVTIGELETEYCIGNIKKRDTHDFTNNKLQDSLSLDLIKPTEISVSPFAKFDSFKDGLFSLSNYLSPIANSEKAMENDEASEDVTAQMTNDREFSIIINKGVADQKVSDSPFTCELEYYMNKVKSNKTNSNIAMNKNNQNTFSKTINQSPLSIELEQYINNNKAKSKNVTNPETNINDKVLSVINGVPNNNRVQKPETHVGNILNEEKRIENIDDSPVKRELESYINKAEFRKKNMEHQECSIDKNLELALKNDNNLQFSLDQLLTSPQVSIRSGTSTPTINNILFGCLKTKNQDVNNCNVESKLEEITVKQSLDPTDFIKDFLKDNSGKCPPSRGFKDMNKLKELMLMEYQDKGTTGFKDINKLKELFQTVNDDLFSIKSESESDSAEQYKDELTDIEEFLDKPVLQEVKVEDDMDMNFTSLLNVDDNQSVDLNFSISSDFLKGVKLDICDEENMEELSKEPHSSDSVFKPINEEDLFKRPFSPPESKYDVENGLCKICDKKYVSERALKIHFIKTHKYQIAKKKKKTVVYVPKFCQICGKSFRDGSNLHKHLKRHEMEKAKFICDYCTLEFPSHGRLTQHMRAHSKEIGNQENDYRKTKSTKNFVCNICGKSSSILANFKMHMRRHTKSYSHTCKLCKKGFYREQDLKQHMVTHGDDTEAFKCTLCPQMYKRRDLLKAHMYRHMNKKDYTCVFCNISFVSKQLLKNHLKCKTCLKKQMDLAEKAKEAVDDNSVTVIHAVGLTDDLIKLLGIVDGKSDKSNTEKEHGETKESAEEKENNTGKENGETKESAEEKENNTGKENGETKESAEEKENSTAKENGETKGRDENKSDINVKGGKTNEASRKRTNSTIKEKGKTKETSKERCTLKRKRRKQKI